LDLATSLDQPGDRKTAMRTLKDLFLGELSDIFDAERRILMELPKIGRAGTCNELRKVIQVNLRETGGHLARLEQVFLLFEAPSRGRTCEVIERLLEEAAGLMVDFKGSPALNTALVSILHKVEHYEIASYGCLHEWAVMLRNPRAGGLLQETLAEEKDADDALARVARARCNRQALGSPGTVPPKACAARASARLLRIVRPPGLGHGRNINPAP
jgi:ferritin-like metal-binding protein YciE